MISCKAAFGCIAAGIILLGIASAPALAADCKEPPTGTKDVPIFSPPLANVVTGVGRLQFYSAPAGDNRSHVARRRMGAM